MEIKFRKELEECGVDVEHGIKAHMGNEEMFVKFLRLVIMDGMFDDLFESTGNNDVAKIFEISHSLKGTIGNVGLCEIDRLISGICDTARKGSMDGIAEKVNQVKKLHYNIKCHIA